MTSFTVSRSRKLPLLAVLLVAVGGLQIGSTGPVSAGEPQKKAKVTICHRTHSVTNPYRRITVAQSSVVGQASSKHGNGTGAHNNFSSGRFGNVRPAVNVFSPNHTYTPAPDKKWGDIVPNVDVAGNVIKDGNADYAGLNYSGAGKAIYDGTTFEGVSYAGLCKAMSAKEFAQSEIDSGFYKDPNDPNKTDEEIIDEIMDDLTDQSANEDAALLKELGSFTGKSLTSLDAVSVETKVPSLVELTSATLNGSFKVGQTEVTSTAFVWGVSADCSNGTTVAASPATVTGTTPVTAALSSLTPNTQYYYKVKGITNAGDVELEATIEGACVPFKTLTVAAADPGSDAVGSGGTTDPGSTGTAAGSPVAGSPAAGSVAGTPNLPATGSQTSGILGWVIATLFAGISILLTVRRRIIR